MRNLRTPLSDAVCKAAQPGEREYSLHDGRQRNLSLRVRPGGTKSWVVRHHAEGNRAKVTIGTFPTMGVKAARKAASAALSGNFATSTRTPLFLAFCAEHESRHGPMLKPSGLRTYRSYVRTQLIPAFGHMPVGEISRRDVLRWFEDYSASSPGGANRALCVLRQQFESAKRWGTVPSDWTNPARGIRANRKRHAGTFLSKDQMERVGKVLANRSEGSDAEIVALRLLMLTGCRVGEVLCLRWSDVLPDRLRLRDSKTGPREVPLGTAAHRLLTSYRKEQPPKIGSATPVFHFPDKERYERLRTVWYAVRRAADLPADIRLHDLRHSFASHAIMIGESLFTVSRLLGHRHVRTTARYAHLADHALLSAAEQTGLLLMQHARAARRSP